METPEVLEGEDRSIYEWTVERLHELGFPLDYAHELAEAGVSWHEAERLIKAGCSYRMCLELLE